jgi:hypothetical protein
VKKKNINDIISWAKTDRKALLPKAKAKIQELPFGPESDSFSMEMGVRPYLRRGDNRPLFVGVKSILMNSGTRNGQITGLYYLVSPVKDKGTNPICISMGTNAGQNPIISKSSTGPFFLYGRALEIEGLQYELPPGSTAHQKEKFILDDYRLARGWDERESPWKTSP